VPPVVRLPPTLETVGGVLSARVISAAYKLTHTESPLPVAGQLVPVPPPQAAFM
jgi:hypothetical protein